MKENGNVVKENGVKEDKEKKNDEMKTIAMNGPIKSVTKPPNIPRKEKSVENLMDDDDYDATPGADERGGKIINLRAFLQFFKFRIKISKYPLFSHPFCHLHTTNKIAINLLLDEHGQSMLHFAAARQHGKNALFQLIEESGVNLSYRDEIYRTARDVSLQASQPENCKEIDRYVLSLAARGK